MRSFREIPIQRKLRAVNLLVCSTALVVACAVLFTLQYYLFRRDFERDLTTVAEIIATNSTAALAFEDEEAAGEILSALKAKPNIVGAALVQSSGQVLASAGDGAQCALVQPQLRAGLQKVEGELFFVQPVALDSEQLGILLLHPNFSAKAHELMSFYLGLLALVLLVSFFVAAMVSWRLEPFILGPIRYLAQVARNITHQHDYSLRARKEAQDELGSFTDSFNQMLDEIEHRDSALRHEIAERKRAEERFSTAFKASPIPQAIQNFDNDKFVDVNDAFARMTGFAREELLGKAPVEVPLCLDLELPDHLSTRPAQGLEAQISTKTGELRPAVVSVERIAIHGEPHLLIMAQDVSERQKLELQLRQAQKMEAIGQLAAGIAHDFNNLLTIIQGHSSLQLAQHHTVEGLDVSLEQIAEAAERAAELTRQLLAFSRQQVMQQRALDFASLIHKSGGILHRLLGERIELKFDLAEGLPPVYGDPTNLEQVLMNLTVNARDAMPHGGRILIALHPVTVTPADAERNPEAQPGEYIRLCVQDNGEGMDEHTQAHIFEPFFTTKEVHKGTGMGLATVYGIAKQHHGWVEVKSARGQGATFSVFLPVTDRTVEPVTAEGFDLGAPQREHTILVVEDDHAVRSLVVEVLRQQHYRVLEAPHADAALEVWTGRRSEIELVLTDIVMPGSMNGLELGRRLQQEEPRLKVIYSSGYSADLFTTETDLEDGRNYLPKPYLFSKLTGMVVKALEGTEPGRRRAPSVLAHL